MARELFYDFIDRKREQHADGNEETYREATPGDYLSPVELRVARLAPPVGTLRGRP